MTYINTHTCAHSIHHAKGVGVSYLYLILADTFISIAGAELGSSLARQARQQLRVCVRAHGCVRLSALQHMHVHICIDSCSETHNTFVQVCGP